MRCLERLFKDIWGSEKSIVLLESIGKIEFNFRCVYCGLYKKNLFRYEIIIEKNT